MSSTRTDWRTPKQFYEELNRVFQFDFDPCPPAPDFDGLSVEWRRRNFVNPPYGSEIGKWVRKGLEESRKGDTVVMPVPSRTNTRWWHKRNRIRGRRLRFDYQEGGAPFRIPAVIFERPRGPAFPKMRGVNSIVEFLWRSERVRSNRPNDRRNIN